MTYAPPTPPPADSRRAFGACHLCDPGDLRRVVQGARGHAFHHDGVVLRGTFRRDSGPAVGAERFDADVDRPVLVRVSRSFDLPQPLPDSLGLAIGWLDACGPGRHRDEPLVSAVGASPGVRSSLAVRREFFGGFYSSLLPVKTGGRLRLIAAGLEAPDERRATTGGGLRDVLRKPGDVQIKVALASLLGPGGPSAGSS